MDAAPHLYTFTGNLLAERTLGFKTWSPGKTQRAVRETFQVGGKGINVSKMLTRLGLANTALCFSGGSPGAECEHWLTDRGFGFRAFPTDLPTRTGTVVRGGIHAETTFLGPDVVPSGDAVRTAADYLDAQPDGHVLAICGSIPGWPELRFDPLRAALERWMVRGALVVDTYGPPLAWFAQRSVALVKINTDEFAALGSGRAATGTVLAGARARWPVYRWVISDGANPVWLRDVTGEPESIVPPPVREVSATGSGDVLFAAIIAGIFHRHQSLHDAVTDALPLAAANAAHPGVAEFP